MTREDKELLLRDLASRLPYGVKVQTYSYEDDIESIETLHEIDSDGYMSTLECDTLRHITKPYLFPRSSMTEEQKIEEYKLMNSNFYTSTVELSDFYNKNHIDYRGLIPLGLAKDATGLGIY